MNTEQLESAKKLFFILLGIDIAITVVVGLNAFSTIGTLKDIQLGTREIDESLLSSLKFWDGVSKLILLTMIGVGLGLVKWLNSCYRFAKESLGATGFKNERWTAAGWIIPIFNLFKPYQIINEIYKAGAPIYTTSDGWKKESGSGLLLTWWIFWAVTHFIGTIVGKQLLRGAMRDDVTLQQVIGGTELQAWACVISVIIAGLWFVVANMLTQRLLERSALPAVKDASGQSVTPIAPPMTMKTTTQQVVTVDLSSNKQQATKPNQANQIMPTSADTAATTQAILVTGQHPTDEDLWAQALSEIENGNKRPGLWAQAFSLSDGDDQKARAKYLQFRADQLIAERNLAIAEQHRRAQKLLAAEQATQDAEQRRREEEAALDCKRLEKIEAEYTEPTKALRNLAYQLKVVGFDQDQVVEQLLMRGLTEVAATRLVSELFGRT